MIVLMLGRSFGGSPSAPGCTSSTCSTETWFGARVAVACERPAVVVEAGDAAAACAVAVATGIGVTEATAVVGVDSTVVMLGDAGDGETDGTVVLVRGIGVDTAGVVVPLGVDGAVAWAGVAAATVGIACPETSRPVRVPRRTAVTTMAGTTNRRTARTIRWPMGAPPS